METKRKDKGIIIIILGKESQLEIQTYYRNLFLLESVKSSLCAFVDVLSLLLLFFVFSLFSILLRTIARNIAIVIFEKPFDRKCFSALLALYTLLGKAVLF